MTPPLSFGNEPVPADDRGFSMRASDADRDHVAKLLGQAFAEGRLSAEEHAERTDGVYAAKTLGELRPYLADLPVAFSPPSAGAAPSARGEMPPAVGGLTDSVVAVFGEQKRRGRWLVRSGLEAKAIFGSVELDLTEAVLEQREMTITATSIFGEVKLIVPEGVMVVNEGTAILGERNMNLSQDQPYTAETPIVHVRGLSLFGNVEAKRPRKKWLKRR
ncbi:DUF1707 SHOCT-like domain-containing protein [Actinospica robiniae]|uniref:DUF1707 SHOCT-like domain-containing protein n=1 Tax=Actinospica robiniae TaxID=304901 RepID=UPI0004142687|nr:DUF1707 domain-containing protein [Actinospica robiniae]